MVTLPDHLSWLPMATDALVDAYRKECQSPAMAGPEDDEDDFEREPDDGAFDEEPGADFWANRPTFAEPIFEAAATFKTRPVLLGSRAPAVHPWPRQPVPQPSGREIRTRARVAAMQRAAAKR